MMRGRMFSSRLRPDKGSEQSARVNVLLYNNERRKQSGAQELRLKRRLSHTLKRSALLETLNFISVFVTSIYYP